MLSSLSRYIDVPFTDLAMVIGLLLFVFHVVFIQSTILSAPHRTLAYDVTLYLSTLIIPLLSREGVRHGRHSRSPARNIPC